MQVSRVRCTMKKNISQWEWEEFEAEVTSTAENPSTGDEMMQEARRICVQHSTEYLAAVRKRNGAEATQ